MNIFSYSNSMTENKHKDTFLNIYRQLILEGSEICPRGLKVLEIENFSFSLEPYVRFANFKLRKLNLGYLKKEFLWYLKGDRFDLSITDHARMWKEIVNKDGSINSNYGQYIFGHINQFDNVIKILRNDKDSRRASIVILSIDHLLSNAADTPCTYAINFRIRKNYLNMSIRMRSQDAIYGFGNDIPCFSFIHEMMLHSLIKYYPTLEYGIYHHTADSFHVYEKHYKMLEKITGYSINSDQSDISLLTEIDNSYELVECPKISGSDEVDFLRKLKFSTIPESFQFTRWLHESK